jgi:hypothetical protein
MHAGAAEPIRDMAELDAVRRQARRVQWQSVLAAVLFTALYLSLS